MNECECDDDGLWLCQSCCELTWIWLGKQSKSDNWQLILSSALTLIAGWMLGGL